MSNVYITLSQLANTSSRNEKISILRTHVNDSILKRVIQLALDPQITFYIKKIPSYEPARVGQIINDLSWALKELDLISSRTVTGNKAIDHLTDILESISAQDANVVERIIAKDLRCGINIATVATIWPDISKFKYPVMLASAFNQKLIDKLVFPCIVQCKLDGLRVNIHVADQDVTFYTRSGNIINIDNYNLIQAFITLGSYYDSDMVFDGELMVIGSDGQYLDRKTGNGIANRAIKNMATVAEVVNFRVVLWDAIPLSSFRLSQYDIEYQTRFNNLFAACATLDIIESVSYISLVPTHIVENFEEALKIFNDYTSSGLEGIIIKNAKMGWSDKRSTDQIKLKTEEDADLIVIDWQEGTGKNAGRLGSLLCSTSDGKLVVGVGTGFSDEQRNTITKSIIGQIITVQYNTKIKDKRSDTWSLFLPRFIEQRPDKDYANSFDELN